MKTLRRTDKKRQNREPSDSVIFEKINLIRLHFLVVLSFAAISCGPQQSKMQIYESDSEHSDVESQQSDVGGLDIGDMASENLNDMTPDLQILSFQEIQDRVFTPYCAGCHNRPTARPDLREGFSYEAILGVTARGFPSMKYVSPGSSSDSWLFRKMEGSQDFECVEAGVRINFCGKSPMPPSFSDLSVPKTDIDALRYWIDSGAKK